jgi:hypothetical protein
MCVNKKAEFEPCTKTGLYVGPLPQMSYSLLGCRQFCPVCLCSFCFASLWLAVLPLLDGAQPWLQVVSLVLFVLLHAILQFSTCLPLFPFCMLVLLEFPVSVVSVLKCTLGSAFCPVAVHTMILCSCRPL